MQTNVPCFKKGKEKRSTPHFIMKFIFQRVGLGIIGTRRSDIFLSIHSAELYSFASRLQVASRAKDYQRSKQGVQNPCLEHQNHFHVNGQKVSKRCLLKHTVNTHSVYALRRTYRLCRLKGLA